MSPADRSEALADGSTRVRSSESLKLFPASLVLDSSGRSCFYSQRSPPKWLLLDLGTRIRIASVSVTMAERTSLSEYQEHLQQQHKTMHLTRCYAESVL